MKAKIIIVDDHPLVRWGIAQFIGKEGDLEVVAEASDGIEALEQMRIVNFDLAIVDIEMRGMSGMELVRNMKIEFPDKPSLMLSMHDESLYAERALRVGARGYLMKEEDPEKVVNAIRTVLKGDVYVSEKATAKILGLLALNDSGSQAVNRFSDRELEIFRMIGEGYRTRHIAEKLVLNAKTVESYKARLKQKLNLVSAAELARYSAEWVKENVEK